MSGDGRSVPVQDFWFVKDILCKACDGSYSALEGEVKQYLWGTNWLRFPHKWMFGVRVMPVSLRIAHALSRFALTVMERAHWSTQRGFSDFDLTPYHRRWGDVQNRPFAELSQFVRVKLVLIGDAVGQNTGDVLTARTFSQPPFLLENPYCPEAVLCFCGFEFRVYLSSATKTDRRLLVPAQGQAYFQCTALTESLTLGAIALSHGEHLPSLVNSLPPSTQSLIRSLRKSASTEDSPST